MIVILNETDNYLPLLSNKITKNIIEMIVYVENEDVSYKKLQIGYF